MLVSRATEVQKDFRQGRVYKLKKSLHGLRYSGRQWNFKIDIAFRNTNTNTCVYVDVEKSAFVMVYVDDILVISKNKQKAYYIRDELKRRFALKDLGDAKYCHYFETQRTMEGYILSQRGYIYCISEKFGMKNFKAAKTSLAFVVKLTDKSSNTKESEQFFREMIGMLMYF